MKRGRIVVTGASGLVGRHLIPWLETEGYECIRMVRRPARNADEAEWDPEEGRVDSAALDGARALVHLAAENVGERWTAAKKRRIRDSRVRGTSLLARTVAGMETPPSVIVAASATGYYGDRGDEVLTESSAPGDDFLASVVQEWEAAAYPVVGSQARLVHLRFGVVLDRNGGALQRMEPFFRLGIGGPVAGGQQYMSWITPIDLVRVVQRVIVDESISGPVNTVSPEPVTNERFSKALGHALHRPAVLPVPRIALRGLFGEMADTVLASQRVRPAVLEAAGFEYRYPTIDAALEHAYADQR